MSDSQDGLGKHLTSYKTSAIGKLLGLTLLSIFSLLVMGLLVIGLPAGYIVYTSIMRSHVPSSAVIFPPSGSFFIIYGFAFYILFIIVYGPVFLLTIQTYQSYGVQVFVHEHGLVYRKLRSQRTIHWRDVREVRHRMRRYGISGSNGGMIIRWRAHTYVINCYDNTSITLYWTFEKIQQLGRHAEVETARSLFPPAWDAFQKNPSMTFGPLTVTAQGIYHRQKLLLWRDMESIDINEQVRGCVVIAKQRRWFRWASVRLGEIPNVELFRELVLRIKPEWVIVYNTRGNVANMWPRRS